MGSTERPQGFLARERRLWQAGTRFVAGIDEAGRGALAGPVVAAAVVFDPGDPIEGVDDSKKLTPRKRDTLFDEISARARAVGVGMAAHDEIDVLNIYRATERAMRRAVAALGVSPALLLVDGMNLTGASCPQEKIIGGDARCYSIAAASIIAKVTRDRIMIELDRMYPDYGFARHKGYGTRLHMQALVRHRACPVHRRTFAPVARQCG